MITLTYLIMNLIMIMLMMMMIMMIIIRMGYRKNYLHWNFLIWKSYLKVTL